VEDVVSGEERSRPFSADEMVEIDRLVNTMPMTPEPDGPLPPLESDDPEWVAARWREWASGNGGPRWKDARSPRKTSQSGVLGQWRADECVLQVWCRRDLIAVVALRNGAYDLVTLARRLAGGIDHETFSLSLTDTHAVACSHPKGRHDLDTAKLLTEARKAAPGKPRVVKMWKVSI
jgi:hypothetical protein